MKFPWMQFFTGDWLKDPALTICTPATRGVWIDLLCAMHELGRSGELRGTHEQLARVARCQTAELVLALTELQTTGAADVTERNSVVTVINRRMKNEASARDSNRLRKQRERSHGNVTPQSRDISQSHKSEVRDKGTDRQTKRARGHPSLEEVKAKAGIAGWPLDESEKFWNHFEASGWIDKNGHPIMNWEAKLSNWIVTARARPYERAHHAKEGKSAGMSTAEMILRKEELEKVEAKISKIAAAYSGMMSWSKEDVEETKRLKALRKELKQQLGIRV